MLKTGLDWALAELLAYATLCDGGSHVRLSGQDVRRGTFSHRHAIWVDQVTSEHYFPLSHLREGQAACDIFNSSLSEMAVLGFEFGYSLVYPNSLVLWEAQFGDFNNGAQVIIDQFIATSEMKWGHQTNLTLLLPHGYEGQGPEHSSARIERFLQLAANENLILANCTTPAQFFHLLRRQALGKEKKPLIVFTPKALLRHPLCRSDLREFTNGSFQEVLDDPLPAAKPRRLAICSGKVYYDLLKIRNEESLSDLTLLRLEQLYPFPEKNLQTLFAKYGDCQEYLWIQEEHSNMGAWEFVCPHLERLRNGPIRYIGRSRSAAPAAGSFALHKRQYEAMVQELKVGST
jgi:2-oxoglutarate dehydrogenase E1 component